tara:strand:- start:481 stop:1410 length:930 start_codon:yes stop_codon:yes gene_type:complete
MQTYGFEIEHCGLNETAIENAINGVAHPVHGPAVFLGCFRYHGSRHLGLRHNNQWVAERDGSLYCRRTGLTNEIVSPILYGIDGLRHLKRVMASMKRAGATVNKSCGLHVTLGVNSSSARFVRMGAAKKAGVLSRIIDAYDYFQQAFDELVSQSRREGAPGASDYCDRVRGNNYFGIATPVQAQRRARGVGRGVVNVGNFTANGTIEFRQHNGTLNGHKIESWALLCQRLVAWAVRTAVGSDGYDVRQHEPTFDGLMEMLRVGSDLKARLVARREQVLNSRYNWFPVHHYAEMWSAREAWTISNAGGVA